MSYSGLFDGHYGTPHTLLADNPGNLEVRLSKIVANTEGSRRDKELLLTLIGASAGSTAAASYTRAQAPVGLTDGAALGGLRTIETVSVLNRATTSDDVTRLKANVDRKFAPTSYPADASGNGGGGKQSEGF